MYLLNVFPFQTDEEKDRRPGSITQINHAGTTEAWNLQSVVNEPCDFILSLSITLQIQRLHQSLLYIWRISSPSASRWPVGWSFWPLARSDWCVRVKSLHVYNKCWASESYNNCLLSLRSFNSVFTETWQQEMFCSQTIRWSRSVTLAWPGTSTKTQTTSAREMWANTN